MTKFEDEARAAYAEELKYAGAGVRITWETEHHIWRTAHDRWMTLWNAHVWSRRTGKVVIPELDAALRDHYRGHTGIHMPLPDEVIAWYMGGGLTDDADHLRNTGSPIRVPEWVLRPDPLRSKLVHIEHSPADPAPVLVPANPATATPDSLQCAFDVTVVDHYKGANVGRAVIGASIRNPIYRGKLRFYIRSPIDTEPELGLSVTVGSRSFRATRAADGYLSVGIPMAQVYTEALGGMLPALWMAITN